MHRAMRTDSTNNTELARLSRAVRFGLASIVLGLSYPNIHCALTIKEFLNVMGDKPTGLGALMLENQHLFVGFSILLPVTAIVTIFTREKIWSIYIGGLLVIAVLVQLFAQWFTLMSPISKMSQ